MTCVYFVFFSFDHVDCASFLSFVKLCYYYMLYICLSFLFSLLLCPYFFSISYALVPSFSTLFYFHLCIQFLRSLTLNLLLLFVEVVVCWFSPIAAKSSLHPLCCSPHFWGQLVFTGIFKKLGIFYKDKVCLNFFEKLKKKWHFCIEIYGTTAHKTHQISMHLFLPEFTCLTSDGTNMQLARQGIRMYLRYNLFIREKENHFDKNKMRKNIEA